MTDKLRTKAFPVSICLVLVALMLAAYPLALKKDMSDFGVCYQAGRRIVRAETLYRASDGHMQYKYAPVAADFYALFGLLPWKAAKPAWYLLTLCLLVAIAVASYRIIPDQKKRPLALLGLTFLVLAKYLARELQLGQVNILIIFLLVAMSALFLARKDLGAGAVWAISLFFKPYALVFLPYFLLKKKFRVLAGGAAALIIGLLLPTINYGLRGNLLMLREWAGSLLQSTPQLLTAGDNASIFAFVLKPSGGQWSPAAMAALGASALIIGLGLLIMMFAAKKEEPGNTDGSRRRELIELAYLLVLIPLFSPLGWNYNYLYGFLAVMIVLDKLSEFPLGLRVFAIANFILIGGTLRETLGKHLFDIYTRHSLVALNFVAVLVLLFLLRVRHSRKAL